MNLQLELDFSSETIVIKKVKKEKTKSKKQIFLDKVTDPAFVPYTIVNGVVMWNEPYRFPDEGSTFRPRCINSGCHNPVALFRGTIFEAKGREVRTVCNNCHLASYGKQLLKEGVTAHKKTYCENIDGHLGFPCTSTIHFSGVLELDHIDGNHFNNIPTNVETLCKVCHAYKTHLNGDSR